MAVLLSTGDMFTCRSDSIMRRVPARNDARCYNCTLGRAAGIFFVSELISKSIKSGTCM